jgi:hypothetical protein
MTFLEWTLSITLVTLYVFALFTVCYLTFRKGYWLLGIIGIFIPLLWLIGAVLPAKQGSPYETDEALRIRAQTREMTR